MAAFGSPDLPAISNPTPTTSLAEVGGGVSAMNPMESVMAIFEDMRNGIDTLVGIATDTLKIEKENKTDADLLSGDKDKKGGGGDDKAGMFAGMMDSLKGAFSVDKEGIGSKLIKLAIAGAFLAITAFGDDLVKVLGPILKKGKEFLDKLSPKGKLYLGLAALAGLLFPKLLGTILFGIGKGSLKLAFKLLTTAFKLMQTFLSDGLIAGLKGAWKGMKGFVKGGMAVLKGAFNGMKTFIMDTVPGAIKGAYKAVKGFAKAGFELLKTGFSAMSGFITETVPAAMKSAYSAVSKLATAGFQLLVTGFSKMSGFITETVPTAMKGAYSAVKTAATAGFQLLATGFSSMSGFITKIMPDSIKTTYSALSGLVGKGLLLLKGAFISMQSFLLTDLPKKIAGTYVGQGILKAVAFLKTTFITMQGFLLTTLPNKIAGSYIGIGITKAITALKAAFVAMQVFLASTMVPAITTMMAPFIVPLALVVAAVLAAVAIFTSIKAGIDEFKQSLADGDSMLEAIISGVATALLTLVTLPITLIKNFAAWALEKLGFEGIAAKLKEFSFVDAIKNGITTLITKIKSFVLGLFDVDFMAFFAKIGNIGMLFLGYIKAIAAGAKAGLLALFPGGDSPTEAYDKAFKKSMANTNAVMEEKRVASVKLAELTRLDNVKKENESNERKMNFYTTTTTNKAGDTINSNAVTLSNLSANHTEPTQMQLNMASR